MSPSISQLSQQIKPILRKRGITRAGLFGSAIHNQLNPESDIDILVELKTKASLLDFLEIKTELEKALLRPVDLVEYQALHPRIKKQVLAEEVTIL